MGAYVHAVLHTRHPTFRALRVLSVGACTPARETAVRGAVRPPYVQFVIAPKRRPSEALLHRGICRAAGEPFSRSVGLHRGGTFATGHVEQIDTY